MVKTFKTMSRDERAEVVRKEMLIPGNSNSKLCKKYGVGLGVIAGIRRDYNIPSTNEAHGGRQPPKPKPKKEKQPLQKPVVQAPVQEKPAPLPAPAPEPPPPEPEVVAPPAKEAPKPAPLVPERPKLKSEGPPGPTKYKMAATEVTQCHAHDEDNRRCGYERVQDSDYCRLPQHQALQKKPARR